MLVGRFSILPFDIYPKAHCLVATKCEPFSPKAIKRHRVFYVFARYAYWQKRFLHLAETSLLIAVNVFAYCRESETDSK